MKIIIILFALTCVALAAYLVALLLKEIRTEYDKKFAYLEMAVRYSLMEPLDIKTITELFREIKKYEIRDDNKIAELEKEFKERLSPPEHSPENLDITSLQQRLQTQKILEKEE